MRRKIGAVCMIIGVLLLIGAFTLLIYNYLDNKRAGNTANAVLKEVQESISENNVEITEDTPAVDIDGKYYAGVLTIPALGLELPVMNDWSYDNLKTAPCRYYGSVMTNDLVVAGHNYSRHFGSLKYLKDGDDVIFTDAEGNDYYYRVYEVVTVNPHDVEEMTSQGDLTLFTCNYSGQARVAVRCERVG